MYLYANPPIPDHAQANLGPSPARQARVEARGRPTAPSSSTTTTVQGRPRLPGSSSPSSSSRSASGQQVPASPSCSPGTAARGPGAAATAGPGHRGLEPAPGQADLRHGRRRQHQGLRARACWCAGWCGCAVMRRRRSGVFLWGYSDNIGTAGFKGDGACFWC